MRNFLLLLLAVGIASCASKKTEPEVAVVRDTAKPTAPPEVVQVKPLREPGKLGFSYGYSTQSIDSIFKLPPEKRPATLEAATNYYLGFPPTVNIPPHLLPPTDLKQKSLKGNVAVYTFVSKMTKIPVEIEFTKIGKGTDSAWIVSRMIHDEKPLM